MPAYARPLRGSVRRGRPAGRAGGAAPLPGRDRGRGTGRTLGRVHRARARRDAGRAQPRLAAQRLPVGARVAWRRFAAAGVAAGLEPETLYLLAESMFAYIDVLSAESAEGHALEQSAAAGEAELRRRRLVRMLVRDPAADPAAVEAAASEAGWPLPRTLAVLAIGGEQRSAAASRLPPDAISEAIGELTCAIIPDPEGRASGALDRARGHARRARARASARPSTGPGRRPSASRAPRRRWSWPRARPGAGRRPRPRRRAAAAQPIRGWPTSWPPTGWRRWPRCRPGSRAAADGDADARGWPSRAGWARSPSGWASTRRPRATGSAGCASCSGESLDDPDGRFWLELALRVGTHGAPE